MMTRRSSPTWKPPGGSAGELNRDGLKSVQPRFLNSVKFANMTQPAPSPESLTWIEAPGGYALAIDGNTIRARNSKGKVLKSVPAAVKKTDEFLELDNLLVWLKSHEAECGTQVETWLLRSLPVPAVVIAAVWPDEAWESWLRDLIIRPTDDASLTGFLREASIVDGTPHLGIVDLDGETQNITAEEILIPHPVLLDDLADLREFAADLGVQQRFDQLQRAVYELPDPLPDASITSLDTWADGRFDQLRFATGRAQSGGFSIKGGYAVTRIYEGGQLVEARYWIGAGDDPVDDAWTDELEWVVGDEVVPVRNVGPVAYSEGVRMASYIYAGRTVDENDEQ